MLEEQNSKKDLLKQQVAKMAVSFVKPGMLLGMGSGTTVACFIKELARDNNLKKSIKVVSTSLDTSVLLAEHDIEETSLHTVNEELDLTVDGADEVSNDLDLIKGGGAALLREKVLAYFSREFLVIVDSSKVVETLGKFPVPVEVVPFALQVVKARITTVFEDLVQAKVRTCKGKLGPLLTDNGNAIIDCLFGKIEDPTSLEKKLNSIPGVVENGLFTRRPEKVLVGTPSGVKTLKLPSN
ncbi:MAG: ribose-5-phosphate isomerase RpiA [Candidatus Hodarchaeales archaeon]|jgi:ribose 5-phosphate isomerase A